ncbi:hypothetical protein GGR57DRAFT_502292 [Xylariaceae sp. FL1272]|nr:hypothetical protein GGR57DRAFT_502292 [Xylariaceae sp. FL1272]
MSGVSSVLTLLSLPAEIRLEIYRLVLCAESLDGRYDFSTARNRKVLQVCRQFRNEAFPIYYGENLWKIKLISILRSNMAYFSNGEKRFDAISITGKMRQHMKRFGLKRFLVVVTVRKPNEVDLVREAVEGLSTVLAELPKLEFLHIRLTQTDAGGDASNYSHVLHAFSVLKDVGQLVVDGVPDSYGQWLAREMIGSLLTRSL